MNRCGATTFLQHGGSVIIAPDTSYIREPVFDQPRILYADLDLDLITQGHLVMDTDGHYARPDVFTLHVNEQTQTQVSFHSR